MRDDLIKLYSSEVQLVEGAGGIFEITQMNKVLFSKTFSGHFPTTKELRELDLIIFDEQKK